MRSGLVVQKCYRLFRDGVRIVKGHQRAALAVQQLDRMQIRRRNDRFARAQSIRERPRNHLPFMLVGRDVDISRADFTARSARLDQEPDFLAKLGAIKPQQLWKFGPGQPPNLRAYLVLQDAAAIFEWLTGTKAAREVDRVEGADAGPFFQFASILWPPPLRHGT